MQIKKLETLTLKKLVKQEIKFVSLHKNHKKIKDYSTKDYLELVQTLLTLSKFIGITEPPDKETLQMLAEFISEYWGDFSKEEIKSAFNHSIINDKTPFSHYNRFTPQLLSGVLNTYKKDRNKAIIKYQKELDDLTHEYTRELKIKADNEELKTIGEWKAQQERGKIQ